jgi:crotonobetainyl-CoA:carnitine CoA-transferase CaiB-like acyl-CoA transferase
MEDFSPLSPDVLTPSQFADLRRAEPAGIKRLMLAVLELALCDATGFSHPSPRRTRKRERKIWRGAVRVGHDNRRVYQGLLGLSDQELRRLEDEKVI